MKLIAIGASVAATLLVTAVAVTPGLAQQGETKEEKKVERVVIVEHKDGAKHGEHRAMRMRGGPGHMAMAHCDGDKTEIDEGEGKERTHIVLCGKGGMSAADRAKKLEEIKARMAERAELSAEHRARVTAAIDRAIERLRSAQ